MDGRGAGPIAIRCALWAAALLIVAAQAGSAQIVGRVMDRGTKEGVPDASVLLLSMGGEAVDETLTDSLGAFVFIPEADSATYTLQVVAPGRVAAPVDPIDYRGRLARRIVVLDSPEAFSQPVNVEGLEVTVEARDIRLEIFGFYERLERDAGTFLQPDDFADAPGPELTQLVRGVSGVFVMGDWELLFQRNYQMTPPGMGGARGLSPGPAPRWRDRYCTPSIWVNGQPDWRTEDMIRDNTEFSRMAGTSANDFLPLKDDIIGIEVYRSRRSLPRDMQIVAERLSGSLDGECGVILLWTR